MPVNLLACDRMPQLVPGFRLTDGPHDFVFSVIKLEFGRYLAIVNIFVGNRVFPKEPT